MTIHQEEVRLQNGGPRGMEVPAALMGRTAPALRIEGAVQAVRRPAARPVPIPVPRTTGHRFLVYKQDPSVTGLGVRPMSSTRAGRWTSCRTRPAIPCWTG